MTTKIVNFWERFITNLRVTDQGILTRQFTRDNKCYLYVCNPSVFQKLACKFVYYFEFVNWKETMSMTDSASIFDPPETVRGMKVLDRSLFRKTVSIPGLAVPQKNIGRLTKALKNEILRFKSIQTVVDLNTKDALAKTHKLILFDPRKLKSTEDFNEKQKNILEKLDVDFVSFCFYNFDMKYENWGHSEVVKAVLPQDLDTVTGFAVVGHIAHLNLREGAENYKYLIGQVILDKHGIIRTVVNKLRTIDSEFRNFQMELLAGEEDYIATVKEHGCTFTFDFSKVYWNTKLGTEHNLVVSQMQQEDLVFDVFAGVGPFAVPCGKKGIKVFANDLNPDSYESLKLNVAKNGASCQNNVQCYNMDGREFIKQIFLKEIEKRWSDPSVKGNVHILMNLPALAVEFLDSFVGLCQTSSRPKDNSCLPFVHCYYFSKSEDLEKDTRETVERVLGCPLEEFKIRQVRNVAPGKEMMCIKFRIPESVLFMENLETEGDGPTAKKICCHYDHD